MLPLVPGNSDLIYNKMWLNPGFAPLSVSNDIEYVQLFNTYLRSPSKKDRKDARAALLDLKEAALLEICARYFEQPDLLTKLKVLRLLGRKGGSEIHTFLMSFIGPNNIAGVRYQLQLAAIEAISYESSDKSLLFLKKTLKNSIENNFDEATVYTLVEAISHAEKPESPTAFESAKFIPSRFKLKKSYETFAKKISGKIESVKERMSKRNAEVKRMVLRNSDSAQDLCVLTLNLGLLNSTFAKVPFYQERSHHLFGELTRYLKSERAADVIFFQELWYIKDFSTVLRAAERCGYLCAQTEYKNVKSNGLQILIRKSVVSEVKTEAIFEPYRDSNQKQSRALFEKAGQVQRGSLTVVITTDMGHKIALVTTHLTPLPRFFGIRNKQVTILARLINRLKSSNHFVVLGADLNIAADYQGIDESPEIFWDLDRFNYLYLIRKTKMLDSQPVVGESDSCFTINQKMAGNRFTNKNVRQRLDYVLTASTKKRRKLIHLESRLEFEKPIDENKLYISDHFGVASRLRLLRITNLI